VPTTSVAIMQDEPAVEPPTEPIAYDPVGEAATFLAAVERELDWDRYGVSECYDEALEEMPGTTFGYQVDITYEPQRPKPALTPAGPTHDWLERCLAIWLRSRNDQLHGTRAQLTLALTPDPRVDGPGK
jgi:hypothetical protein